MTGTFEIIKQRVDILEVAEMYGLQVKRNKALCCFHDDHHASMSFRNQRFTCWVCGEHGDVFDLVSKLTGSTAIEAAKQLNDAFHLGLDMDRPVKPAEAAKFRREREAEEIFKQWENDAFLICRAYNFYIQAIIKGRAPRSPTEPIDAAFVQALHEQPRVEYFLDILTFGTPKGKVNFYNTCRNEVTRYGRILRGFEKFTA